MISPKSIKFRLTIWYILTVGVLLVVFGTISYYLLSKNLYRNLDDTLKSRVLELKGSIRFEGDRILLDQNIDEIVLIYNANGKLMNQLGANVDYSNIGRAVRRALLGTSFFVSSETADGVDVRFYAVPINRDSQTRLALIVGKVANDVLNVLAIFRIVILNSSIFLIVLTGLGGWFLAGQTLKPVDRITDIARGIGESDLSRRIDIVSDDELGRLAATLNGMISRLEEAFLKERRFVADASHELRTPLAVLQAETSLALEKPRDQEAYRASLETVSQEVAYMADMVGKLLILARSDAGRELLNVQEVDVAGVLAELVQDVEALAQDRGLTLHFGPLDSVVVNGDRVRLRQLFLNILDNALRYTPSGGTVSGSVLKQDGRAVITIGDTGTGIAAEHLPFIFDRFYRADRVRTDGEGGTGLGLSIATSIAKMHGGTIEVESRVGEGTTFRIVLPLAAPAEPPASPAA
jgi:heavy metal sensor kinase